MHASNVRHIYSTSSAVSAFDLLVYANHPVGALKATGNRGLQPAMDYILEHEGQPVPDLGVVSESASSSTGVGAGAAMDVDDDEDAEALKSLGVVTSNAVEAKVL